MGRPAELVVRGFLDEVWSHGETQRAAAFVHPDYEVPGVGRGPAAVSTNREHFGSAFPDLCVDVLDVIADGCRVAAWMRLSGTHRGTFRGHEATGRRAVWEEVGFFVVEGGLLVRARFLADVFGLRKALGVIPADLG